MGKFGLPLSIGEFFACLAAFIVISAILSIRLRVFLWPIFAGLRQQARLLSAAHVVLFLACFLFCANRVIERNRSFSDQTIASPAALPSTVISASASVAGKIALPLFIFGALLLLPGIYHQKKIDPEKYLERAIRNGIRLLAIGLLLIPGFIILYYFAYALTDFIRD